ncbi:MAG: hypothetical protein AABX66_00750, partial [Nanoarchaeota archaeon]
MRKNLRGQVSIYVIVAIAIVVIIGIYFLVTKIISPGGGTSGKFNEVYQYYDLCIERELKDAVDLAGTQGGRVYTPDFIPGSEYAPFSSQYNFMGFGVPYWMWIASNSLIKEQVPSKQSLENDIARYLNENLGKCDFSSFSEKGYSVSLGEISSKVVISQGGVRAEVDAKLDVQKDGQSEKVLSRSIDVQTNIGLLLDEALRIFAKEKAEAFLENYSVDVLRLNAPVDGTLVQCNPEVWKTNEIKESLQNAIEANLGALKFRNVPGDYFAVGIDSKVSARVLYSKSSPQVLEISGEGAKSGFLIAKPIGNQEGLGVMGFCYVPYHYVYDWRFPVMIQLMAGNEVFQFPVVVVVDKNLPRKGIYSNLLTEDNSSFDLCEYKTQDISVNALDINLNSVDANIKYQCFDQECDLGNTKGSTLITKAPACVNGFLIACANGFDETSQLFSSNEQS